MTQHREALGKIAEAERCVTNAADRWNAVDLSAIGNCVSALECAATDLSEAAGMLAEPSNDSRTLCRPNIIGLKKSLMRLERLVGASAAFLRGAPGPSCEDAGFYQAGGSMSIVGPDVEIRGMQG